MLVKHADIYTRESQNIWEFRPKLEIGIHRDRGAIFGLRGPNAELPTGWETGWCSEFTGLRQQQ